MTLMKIYKQPGWLKLIIEADITVFKTIAAPKHGGGASPKQAARALLFTPFILFVVSRLLIDMCVLMKLDNNIIMIAIYNTSCKY